MKSPKKIGEESVLSTRGLAIKGLMCTVLLITSFIFFSSNTTQETQTVTLRTEHVELLPPHGHEIGKDSMGDDGHHVGTRSDVYIAPRDMWVTGMDAQIHGAPALTLHHGTIFRMDEQDLECPSEGPRPIVSIAQDQMHTPELQFEEGYGIFIPKGTPLLLDAMFHNPEPPVGPGDIYEHVSLEFNLMLATTTEPLQKLTYHLLRLSDTPCRDYSHTFTVPPASEAYIFSGTDDPNDASKLYIQTPSRVVYWGAHVHGWEGGESLTVYQNNEVVKVFQTKRSPEDAYRFNTPHGPQHILLNPGDVLSLESTYKNSTDNPLRGAMGHLGVYIAE